MSEPGFGAKEPPPGTPDQAGLRIKSFVGIKAVSEPGFGAKEPPLGTREHLVACLVVPTLGTSLTKWVSSQLVLSFLP